MKMMEGRKTYSRMMMRIGRATGWNSENHRPRQRIKTTLPHYLKIHYLERASVLALKAKITEVHPKRMKRMIQAREEFKEKKNGFLTL